MRKLLMVAAGLALLAATAFSAPTQAMPISAPALKGASDSLATTEQVGCWGGGCYYGGGYYGGGYGYRPYYRPYYGYGYGYRPYYGYYRPYYRSYWGGGCGYGYGGCGYHRPYYRTYYGGCGGGCGYGYGYYPRPRAYFFNRVYYW
jgi:hypothetical protein